jgi:hypothetical protein
VADGKQWVKLYTKALNDPDMCDMHNQTFGVWARIMMLVGEAGTVGSLTMSRRELLFRLHLSDSSEDEINTIFDALKTVHINSSFCNGKISVTVERWNKYQIDSSSYERVKNFRNKQNETDTVTGEEKREEEKRKEKKRRENNKEKKEEDITVFVQTLKQNTAYSGIDIDREIGKMQAWLATPKGKGRKLSKGFMVNWLNKIDAPIDIREDDKRWE